MAQRLSDRRGELVEAAIRVFAERGFHAARVGDIAGEAGVAHGLLYHYFRSKDEVLETIFRETWTVLVDDLHRIEHADVPLREQLRRFARIYLGSWLVAPDLVRVLVREVARNRHIGQRTDEIAELFGSLERMVAAAKERGEARADVDPRIAAWVIYGAFEEVLTGWVLGWLPGEEDDVERAVVSVVEVAYRGLAA